MSILAAHHGALLVPAGGGYTQPVSCQEWHYGSDTQPGGEWTDRSGNSNHSAPEAGVSITDLGALGTGVGGLAFAASPAAVNAYTLMGWIRADASVAGDLGVAGNVGDTPQYWLDYNAGAWRLASYPGATYGNTNFNPRTEWHHYAWVCSGTTVTFYRDGEPHGAFAFTAGLTASYIMRAQSKRLKGRLDDFMYCNAALSQSDVQDHYSNPPGTRTGVWRKGPQYAPTSMTNNSTPAPYVAAASSEYNATFAAFAAFGTNWWLGSGGGVDWLSLDLGAGTTKRLHTYSIDPERVTRSPRDWTMEGSNNGSDWDVLDTQTGVAGFDSTTEFECNSIGTAYRHYRLNITDNNGDATYIAIESLMLYEAV